MNHEQIPWQKGLKKTKPREMIIDVLTESDHPLTAAEIHARLDQNEQQVWLSTVYRTLELFVKKGIVTKTNVMSNETAVYEWNRLKHTHYAVCISCHKIIPMENCPMEAFTPQVADPGFQILGHNIEVFGICADCREDEA